MGGGSKFHPSYWVSRPPPSTPNQNPGVSSKPWSQSLPCGSLYAFVHPDTVLNLGSLGPGPPLGMLARGDPLMGLTGDCPNPRAGHLSSGPPAPLGF